MDTKLSRMNKKFSFSSLRLILVSKITFLVCGNEVIRLAFDQCFDKLTCSYKW